MVDIIKLNTALAKLNEIFTPLDIRIHKIETDLGFLETLRLNLEIEISFDENSKVGLSEEIKKRLNR